jgi:thiol-disulfide isomerase/thioredoxin
MAEMFNRLLLAIAFLAATPAEKAPELRASDVWINADAPLKISALKGKVVLLDFWAFDCDPCKETIPHVRALYEKYSREGLVVIGVHTPRTSDERQLPKLKEAVTRMGIPYPVVVDKDQKVFKDYRCDLWPTQFVIDKKGIIRLSHGGVGRYVEIEEAVRTALSEP